MELCPQAGRNGYDTVLFSSAEAFKNQVDFEDACCVVLDINLEEGSGIDLRHRLKADRHSVPVIYDCERRPCRSQGCAGLRMHRASNQALLSSGGDGAAQKSWQAIQQRGQALTHQRLCHALCGASVSPVVGSSYFIVRFCFGSCASLSSSLVSPTGELAGSRLELRLRSDLKLFHDPLTLRCNWFGGAAELSGNLFVCFYLGEAPQQLPLLRRQLISMYQCFLCAPSVAGACAGQPPSDVELMRIDMADALRRPPHHAVVYMPTGLVVMALRNASGEAMVEMVCVPSPTP